MVNLQVRLCREVALVRPLAVSGGRHRPQLAAIGSLAEHVGPIIQEPSCPDVLYLVAGERLPCIFPQRLAERRGEETHSKHLPANGTCGLVWFLYQWAARVGAAVEYNRRRESS